MTLHIIKMFGKRPGFQKKKLLQQINYLKILFCAVIFFRGVDELAGVSSKCPFYSRASLPSPRGDCAAAPSNQQVVFDFSSRKISSVFVFLPLRFIFKSEIHLI